MTGYSQRIGLARSIAIAVATVSAIAVIGIVAKFCLTMGLAWRCPALSLLGIPCPSCGSTRAFAALAEFDLIRALKLNPLMVIGIFALPFLCFESAVPMRWKAYGWPIFGTAVLVNWIYLLLFLPR
jgi:hypothetical protein